MLRDRRLWKIASWGHQFDGDGRGVSLPGLMVIGNRCLDILLRFRVRCRTGPCMLPTYAPHMVDARYLMTRDREDLGVVEGD